MATRAQPPTVFLVDLGEGFSEAAERVLVPHERDLVLLLIEIVVLVVGPWRGLLHALGTYRRLGCEALVAV